MISGIVETLSGVATSITISSTFPQFWQTIRTRLTRDLNKKALAMCVIGQSVWVSYAVITNQPIIVIGESIDTAMQAGLFIMAAYNYYKMKREREGERIKRTVEISASATSSIAE